MKRTTLFLALLALITFAAHAQHFEWAKNYHGYEGDFSMYTDLPRGLVADSEGNTYHLMQVARGGQLDGIDPFAGITNLNTSALLVKRSPDGQYLWHRVINSDEGINESPIDFHDLRMLGDTALMMMVSFLLPHTDSNYNTPLVHSSLYYLDTLLTTSDLLMPTDSTISRMVTAFITLGLDGKLKEQHFVQVSYLDSLGQPVVMGNYGIYSNDLPSGHFDVDSRGNIYAICHTQDMASGRDLEQLYFHDGGLSGYRFVVDGTQVHTHIPPYHTGWWNQLVLKFSPHFDSLLDASYLVDDVSGVDWYETPMLEPTSFDIHNDQLYITLLTLHEHDSMPIARSNGLRLEVDSLAPYSTGIGCLLRLDTGLNANLLMQFNFPPRPGGTASTMILSATCVDTATGSLFVLGKAHPDPDGGNKFIYRGDTLDNNSNAFWLRVGLDDGHYLSYGRINSSNGHSTSGMSIAARDNRVFAQMSYNNSIRFVGTTLHQGYSQTGLALAQWDYDGHEVAIYDFHCNHEYSLPGHVLLTDTAVYVTGNSFTTPTSFGDIACGNGQFIAKLVDTSMRSPYVFDTANHSGSMVRIATVDDEGSFVVYPNPFWQKVTVQVESGDLKVENGTVTAWLTDMSGRREQVRLNAEGSGRYSLDLTSHPQATYLLTLTTASGKTHTVKLMKQSDIFGH